MDPVMTVEDLIIALGEFPADASVLISVTRAGDSVEAALSAATYEEDVVTLSS